MGGLIGGYDFMEIKEAMMGVRWIGCSGMSGRQKAIMGVRGTLMSVCVGVRPTSCKSP